MIELTTRARKQRLPNFPYRLTSRLQSQLIKPLEHFLAENCEKLNPVAIDDQIADPECDSSNRP